MMAPLDEPGPFPTVDLGDPFVLAKGEATEGHVGPAGSRERHDAPSVEYDLIIGSESRVVLWSDDTEADKRPSGIGPRWLHFPPFHAHYPGVGPVWIQHSAPGLQREKTGVQMSHYLVRDIRSRRTTSIKASPRRTPGGTYEIACSRTAASAKVVLRDRRAVPMS